MARDMFAWAAASRACPKKGHGLACMERFGAMLRAIDAIGEPTSPIELNSLEIDQSGVICHRPPKFPLTFNFSWRENKFEGAVDQVNGRMTLELRLTLGDVPYAAEVAAARGKWSTVVCKFDTPGGCPSQIVRESSAILLKTIQLPQLNGFTADGFVTNIALMVLSLAPYVDLIAEYKGNA